MKHKQILAVLLVITNIIVSITPAGLLEVRAENSSENSRVETQQLESSENTAVDNIENDTAENPTNTTESTEDSSVDSAGDTAKEEENITDNNTGDENKTEDASASESNSDTSQQDEQDETQVVAEENTYLELEQLVSDGVLQKSGEEYTVKDSKSWILLSNCNPKEIQNITIKMDVTGAYDLRKKPDESTDTEDKYKDYIFKGIGTSDVPFAGKIMGENVSIKIDRTFFGGLYSSALSGRTSALQLTWCGDDSVPMIADVYVMDGEPQSEHRLPIKVSAGRKIDENSTESEYATMGSLIGTIQSNGNADQTLKIDGNLVDYTNASAISVSSSTGNSGLICNTLKSGTISLNGYNFPTTAITVNDSATYTDTQDETALTSGNAGGLIGAMAAGTTLDIKSLNLADQKINVTSSNGNAGGLVGLMQQGAKITTGDNTSITLKEPTVTGGVSAGGVVGTAIDVTFDITDLKKAEAIKVTTPKVQANGTSVPTIGGLIGKYTLNAGYWGENASTLKLPEHITLSSPNLIVSNADGMVGGYFGQLDLNGTLTYSIGDSNNKKEINPTYTNCTAKAAGAIAGKVTSDTIASTLQVQNIKATATNNSGTNIQYHGGLFGMIGEQNADTKKTYLNVSNSEINVSNPSANDNDGYGFGGIIGLLTPGSILQVNNNIEIASLNDSTINQGGGLVGYADRSVINVSGTTDLSRLKYAEGSGKSAKTGWAVGKQESALIYANGDGNGEGWTYIRGKEATSGKQAMNDIGNYGQIIRLKSGDSTSKLSEDLITINSSHEVIYKNGTVPTINGEKITLGSEDAFARLSIAWNSRGYFGGITEITSENFSTYNLRAKNISIGADIDLTGSGITGLSRDAYNKDDIFIGELDGSGKEITLAIGETYGCKEKSSTFPSDGEDGYGEVISANADKHGRQGLFAVISGAKVNNLTIAGKISVSNNAGADILIGGIAGEMAPSDNSIIISNVTTNQTITADCEKNQGVMAGGFFGGSYDKTTLQLGEDGNENSRNIASATIKIKNCSSNTPDTKINAGEIVGEIGEKAFSLEANCLTIKGTISTDVLKKAYVGGMIGVIKGHNTAGQQEIHKVKINGVRFDGFSIVTTNNKTTTSVCGGLLGSVWCDVGVYFNGKEGSAALDVIDATINAPNATDVGGLAYRSSGKWEIGENGIYLRKFSITAKQNLGLLVCRGYKGNDTIAENTSKEVGALYLYTTNWNTSYKIANNTESLSISKDKGVFDEFVAYSSSSASNITTNNVNGIISIATAEETSSGGTTSRVGVDVSKCTTYQNRTTYGQSHQTNSCSRYYYDLDQCLSDMYNNLTQSSNGDLDTPQEFLIWSVYNYAYSNIRQYFNNVNGKEIPDITKSKQLDGKYLPMCIGKRDSSSKNDYVTMDMSKYSYYPIKSENLSINIMNAVIKFNNAVIEKFETNNKSTQSNANTQHFGMHCGIFLTYQATSTSNIIMTVTHNKFTGSIGKIDDNSKSGLLVSDFASGTDLNGAKKLVISINDLILNDLKVTNCGEGYAPLLINNISNNSEGKYKYGYSTLNIDDLTTTGYSKGTAVASSLVGTVGSFKAVQINMTFQNIVLPDKKADVTSVDGIFSHATLLESYAYSKEDNSSNATYNFYSSEDWDEEKHIHQVTYGKEITETAEYANLQKWYFDEATHGIEGIGLVYDDINKKTSFDAKDYLPYVCKGYDKDNSLHEIKVNQRVKNILNGCGTYSHPYKIQSEQEMNILAEFMAGSDPRKDWIVKITKDQNVIHTANSSTDYKSDNDVTYRYNGSTGWVQVINKGSDANEKWEEVPEGNKFILSTGFIRDYLLNAYYDIQGTVQDNVKQLVLTNFKGFGSESNPFRGVITSTDNTTIVLDGVETGNGLITYSNGSVVKNLSISYTGKGKTLTLSDSSDTFYPRVCFGGVIGCVLGGDNIIDNVSVSMTEEWKLTLSGDKRHLIQVGGYVGSICGGGVIFRNLDGKDGLSVDDHVEKPVQTKTQSMPSDLENSLENILSENKKTLANLFSEDQGDSNNEDYSDLYINPYVGRVLDGFAFYEADSAEKTINNTNKNYKINTITVSENASNLNIENNSLTVNDAQGLLLLSAIVNSGAASNGISEAYSRVGNNDNEPIQYTRSDGQAQYIYSFGGRYGKVRNASYNSIGTTENDAEVSKAEDIKLPGEGNLPYLIQKYAGNQADMFGLTTKSDLQISLSGENTTYDMTGYGNGYQGISARYVTTAVRGHVTGNRTNHPEGVVPAMKNFNGNNKILKMDIQVREYSDDDFHAASVGGLFNILRLTDGGAVSNLTLNSQTSQSKSVISVEYFNSTGQSSDAQTTWANRVDVGVGGLIGSMVGYADDYHNRNVQFNNIQLHELSITGPANVGGIIGNTGKSVVIDGDKSNRRDISVLLQRQSGQAIYGSIFNNCTYKNVTVEGKYASGGFVGYIGGDKNLEPLSAVIGGTGIIDTSSDKQKPIILATDSTSCAGGLFGYVQTRLFINMGDDGTKKETKTILQNVNVTSGQAVGGLVGKIDNKCYGIHNVEVKGITQNTQITLNPNTTGTFYAGGIVGYAFGKEGWHTDWKNFGGISSSSIDNVQINTEEISNKYDYSKNGTDAIKTNYIAGGIIGQVAGGKTIFDNCKVNAGKIYGSVAGGIAGQTDFEIEFKSCETKGSASNEKTEIKGFSTAGGVLGFWKGGQPVTIEKCKVQFLNIEGKDWGDGAFIGDAATGGAGTLYLFDSSAKDSSVQATGKGADEKAGGRWPVVGSIIGNLRNTIKASNLLLSGITLSCFDGSNLAVKKGLLFGNDNDNVVNIAGISIQNIPESNKEYKLTDDSDEVEGYIAFSDYTDAALDSAQVGKSEELLVDNINSDIAEPYVTTSPKKENALSVSPTADGSAKYLYGDGASWTLSEAGGKTSFKVNAQTIFENKDSIGEDGRYAYKKIANNGDDSVSSFDFVSIMSTYNTNQDHQVTSDFPVVQVSNGNANAVKDYLNIVTNGGFSAANKANAKNNVHVTAKADIYTYTDGKFVKVDGVTPAFRVETADDGKITFKASTDYDNGKDRFTLVTVTFTESGHHYNVFVPVLVRRLLEMDFTATLTYGTDFKSSDYSNLSNHILESFGSSITGYLTYAYNSAAGTYTDYGWQTYINAGGNLMDMKKSIQFNTVTTTSFPQGTQFTLIDTKTKKSYYYTATGNGNTETGAEVYANGGINIPLSCFKASDKQTSYIEPSISELLGVSVDTKAKDKTFIKVDVNGKPNNPDASKNYPAPTIKIKDVNEEGGYAYYRLADQTLGETGTCAIVVNESNLVDSTTKKSKVEESYYLVVTVPKSDTDTDVALNGSVQTTISSSIPNRINYRKLVSDTASGYRDQHENTASTYQLSEGYKQVLNETGNDGTNKEISLSNTKMKVDITDTITFPKKQVYNSNDKLYLKFITGLQKGNSSSSSAEQFPSGTTGTANFYVYTEDEQSKQYYTYKNGQWEKQTDTSPAVSYQWSSTGGNMELPLSLDGKEQILISLDTLRDAIKEATGSEGTGEFKIQMVMDLNLPPAGLDVIPESSLESGSGLPKEFAKLSHSVQLSTVAQSLNYSTNRATVQGTTAYYRPEASSAKFTYDADQIDQLGINLLDLRYLDASGENAQIDTTATYDLSSMKNLKEILKNSGGIRFTLTLAQKNNNTGEQEKYSAALNDADQYISVELKSEESEDVGFKEENGVWSWTIPKEFYYDTTKDMFITDGIFDGDKLVQLLRLKVDVDKVEALSHLYSNYKVALNVEILNKDGNAAVDGTQMGDSIIYTITKISQDFAE